MTDELDPGRTVLIFFDMLKRFDYRSDFKSLLPEARSQVDACVRLLAAARDAGVPVAYACRDHRPDGLDLATAISDDALARSAQPRGPDPEFNLVLLQDAIRTADEDIQAYFMTDVFPRLGRVRTVD